MRATHCWFREGPRPLAGWIHLPESGEASGVAVLCAPLGHEAANALWALQTAADRLTRAGIAALRFDYSGTGDSAGELGEPARLAEWRSDIDAAVDFARELGTERVVLAGMRIGALLAADAVAAGTRVDGLVLWDPYATGRSFFRVEQTLLAAGYGASQPGDGSIAGPGFHYSADLVEELTPLRLGSDLVGKAPTLVLARAGDRAVAGAREECAILGAEWQEILGQPELLDVPPDMISLPDGAIDRMVGWTVARLEGESSPVRGRSGDGAARFVVDGGAVREHPVWLGPHAIFGIMAEPDGAHPVPDTVVFLSAGALDHSGPGRLWVDLSRRFAARGLRSVRVDLDGIGETFGRKGAARNIPKPADAIDDICDVAAALGDPDAENLLLVGLSSGGYHAIEAGLRLHPRGVCAINPGVASWVPEVDEGRVDPRRRAYRPMPKIFRRLAVKHGRLARWSWRLVLQVWVERSPNQPVAEVARRGVRLLVIVNEHDSTQFERSLYWSIAFARLRRRGLLEIAGVPGSDHSLYTPAGSARATTVLFKWVLSRYGRPRASRAQM